MAIYHCSIKNISRSGGKSAVASASYRAGEKLKDRETGLTHDYTNKKEVAYSEIFLCENAPREYQNRETLWNAIEEVEKQSNARLAREWEVALPNELTLDQSKELVREFAQSLADEGMCVDANIHWKEGNHHAHIMGTTRPIKKNGEWGQKEKKAYKLDENGQKIPQIDPKTGGQKIGARGRKMWERETVEANDWNKSEKVEEWRKRWAEHCNRYLAPEQQIDHQSYERQGKEQIPTVHEGHVAREMEQKGQTAERCEINRDIMAANMELKTLEQFLKPLIKKVREAKEALKANEPVGRNADGDKPAQADHSRQESRESKDGYGLKGNIVSIEPFASKRKDGSEINGVNVSLVFRDENKNKAYKDCVAYGAKAAEMKDFKKGDFVNLFGYDKVTTGKDGKVTKYIVQKSSMLKTVEQQQQQKAVMRHQEKESIRPSFAEMKASAEKRLAAEQKPPTREQPHRERKRSHDFER